MAVFPRRRGVLQAGRKMQSWVDLVSGNGDTNDLYFDDFEVEKHVEQVAEQSTPQLKASKKRTRNFTVHEDNMLVTAWLQITLDPVQGADQTHSTYWQRIHDYYHEHKNFESERNISSLSHRWGIIHKSVNTFCGWYTQVQNRKESGLTEQDKIQGAKELYQEKDREGKSFTLMHCWTKLRNEQKWADLCSETSQSSQKKHKTSSTASPGSCTPGTHESNHADEEDGPSHTSPRKGRPDGKKKEKARLSKNCNSQGEGLYMEAMEKLWAKREKAEELKEIKKKERNDERLAVETRRLEMKQQVENRRLDLMQREIELKQREDDLQVMRMDVTGMDEDQKLFYKTMRAEIIARRCGGGN